MGVIMKKELTVSIIIFICLMIGFLFSVKITEEQNNKSLVQNYTYSSEYRKDNGDYSQIAKPSEKAIEYQQKKVAVWVTRIILGMIIPAVFIFSRLSCSIRNWAQSKSSMFLTTIILYFALYYTISTLLTMPLDYYSSYVLKHAYSLSNQTLAKWISDFLKTYTIGLLSGALFIWIPYLLIKKSPGYWWLQLGILIIPIIFFVTFISPVYIDPLFNKYEKMQDTVLEQKIYDEISKTTIGNCKVYQINKSVDTKEMNAYMTGVLNTKRIVLWDTTIKNLNQREVLCIVAHEMGHYLMGHVWKAIIFAGTSFILILYLINKSAIWVLDKSGGVFGFTKLHDVASLPLIILLVNIFIFVGTPLSNAYSRYTEMEADRFELELTRDNEASISSTIKLHEESLVLPTTGVVYKLWNYTHPTFQERVEFANKYKPWEENKPLKYGKYIK
jgi:STE24 endopeptidase